MNIGYTRVSTKGQSVALQLDALQKAGCEKSFQEVVSGGRPTDRYSKNCWIHYVLVIWKLDRSLKHLGASRVKIFMRPPDGNIAEVRPIVLDNALDCPQGSVSWRQTETTGL